MPRAFGHKQEDERRVADFYPTPDLLALACCKAVREIYPHVLHAMEPSAGSGAFVRGINTTWPAATIAAVEQRGEEVQALRDAGADSISTCTLEVYLQEYPIRLPILVIGNPPYSLAQEHIMLLLDYLPPDSTIAFLLKLGFLGTKTRADLLWKQGQCKYVWPILGRPSFVKSDRASSDVNEYALFIWEVGYTGPTFVRWPHIRWKKERGA
jgi:hypothetical protein